MPLTGRSIYGSSSIQQVQNHDNGQIKNAGAKNSANRKIGRVSQVTALIPLANSGTEVQTS